MSDTQQPARLPVEHQWQQRQGMHAGVEQFVTAKRLMTIGLLDEILNEHRRRVANDVAQTGRAEAAGDARRTDGAGAPLVLESSVLEWWTGLVERHPRRVQFVVQHVGDAGVHRVARFRHGQHPCRTCENRIVPRGEGGVLGSRSSVGGGVLCASDETLMAQHQRAVVGEVPEPLDVVR